MMYSLVDKIMYIVTNVLVLGTWAALAAPVAAMFGHPAPSTSLSMTPQPRVVINTTTKQSASTVGDLLNFSLHVMNYGDRTAEHVQVTDVLPQYLELFELATSRGQMSSRGNHVLVDIGTLAPGEEAQIHIWAYVRDNAPSVGSNTATVDDRSSSTATFRVTDGIPVVGIAQRVRLPVTSTGDALDRDDGSLAAVLLIGTMGFVLGVLIRRGA